MRKAHLSEAVAAGALVLFGFTLVSHADPLSIANYSFQDPVRADGGYTIVAPPSWTKDTGTSTVGVWNAVDNGYPGATDTTSPYFGVVPNMDGRQVGFFSGGTATSLTQTLAAPLTVNTKYTLTVAVGYRADTFPFHGYTIALLAGGTPIASLTSDTPPGAAGTFTNLSLSYTALSGDPRLGQILGVRFGITSAGGGHNNAAADFDNVRLDASAVPEPGALALMAAGLTCMVGLRRHRRKRRKFGSRCTAAACPNVQPTG